MTPKYITARDLGIKLETKREAELSKWFIACILFSKPIQQTMMYFLFGEKNGSVADMRQEDIAIESSDRESLLVDWLSELLYRTSTGRRAYLDYDMQKLAKYRTQLYCYFLSRWQPVREPCYARNRNRFALTKTFGFS